MLAKRVQTNADQDGLLLRYMPVTTQLVSISWEAPKDLTVSAEVTSRRMWWRRTVRHHDSPLRPDTAADTHAPATSDGGQATNLKSTPHTHTPHSRHCSRSFYDVVTQSVDGMTSSVTAVSKWPEKALNLENKLTQPHSCPKCRSNYRKLTAVNSASTRMFWPPLWPWPLAYDLQKLNRSSVRANEYSLCRTLCK